MKIAVNTRLLLKDRLEGIGWFTFESLKRIVASHPEHEFYFIFDRPYSAEFIFADNVHPVVIGPPARHPILFYLWYEFSLPRALKRIDPDLFVSPDALTTLNTRYPDLVVLHDLNFEHYPEFMPRRYRKYYLRYTPKFAKKATRIATVSQYTKSDICNIYNVSHDKVDVLYNGSNQMFRPLTADEKIRAKNEYAHGNEYFVFISAFNPRKNLQNIFTAFDRFVEQKGKGYKFVVVGEKMYWSDEIRRSYEQMRHKSEVVFTGRLSPNKLSLVLGGSISLVYASLFEGFGIPIIEAFHAEVPVITSDVTSMPEIAGDAAILVKPTDPDSITKAMIDIVEDEKLALTLVEKGRERRNLFSWDKTAENLWRSIEKTIETNQNQQ